MKLFPAVSGRKLCSAVGQRESERSLREMFGRGEFLCRRTGMVLRAGVTCPVLLSSGGQSRGPGFAQPEGESSGLTASTSELAAANRDCSHVIGQDLREECIKLKMLVFDLERQNRALCELFQQKLPNQPAAHFQVASVTPRLGG